MQEKKKLNLFDVFSLGIGGAIGSGIFVMMGLGIGYTGRSIFLAVTIGCVYMLLAYFYQVVIASMFVVPGGFYDMQAMLFTPTLAGVSAIFVYASGLNLAAYALAMVQYIGMIIPGVLPLTKVIATVIIVLFFAATIKGSKFIAILGDIMAVVLFAAIALFVVMGLPKVQPGYFSNADGGFFFGGTVGLLQAISIMSFACQGATGAPCSMMPDIKNARRTAPIAVLLITVALAAVYGLMSIVAAGVLPLDQVIGQNLSVVAHTIFPNWMYVIFILGGAVFAIATSLLSTIAQLRHPCMQVANDGWMPAVFKRQTNDGFPYVLQGFFLLVSLIFIWSGYSLESIISLAMIPQMLMSAYLNFSLIRFVKKYPEQWKTSILHMPMPVFSVLCVLSTVCAFLVAYNLFVTLGVAEMLTCVAIIAICLGVAVLRIKTGAVNKEEFARKSERIALAALAATEKE